MAAAYKRQVAPGKRRARAQEGKRLFTQKYFYLKGKAEPTPRGTTPHHPKRRPLWSQHRFTHKENFKLNKNPHPQPSKPKRATWCEDLPRSAPMRSQAPTKKAIYLKNHLKILRFFWFLLVFLAYCLKSLFIQNSCDIVNCKMHLYKHKRFFKKGNKST